MALRESLDTGDFRLAGHVSYTADEIKGDLARRLDHYRNVNRILEEKEATLKAKQKAVVAAHQQLMNMAAQKKALLAKLEGIEARLKMIEATQATNEFNFDDSALARAKQTVSELEKRLDVMARFAELEGRFSESGSDGHRGPGRDVVKEIDAEFGAPDRARPRRPRTRASDPDVDLAAGPAQLPRDGRRQIHPGLRPAPPRGDPASGRRPSRDRDRRPDDRLDDTSKTWAATATMSESNASGPRTTAPWALPGATQRRLNLPWYGGALPMVNPGGKLTMLGHWRMVLRQAEEAARAGRFDEALALASRPDVADHHHAVQLRGRFALDLIARASRRGEADDLAGAIDDLDLAERLGAAPDVLAAARLSLADRVADEVRSDLDAGEPARVVERVEHLARHKIGGPALRRAREVAEAWQAMHEEARRGEFGRAGRTSTAPSGWPGRPRRPRWPPADATWRRAGRPPRPGSRRSTPPWRRASGPRRSAPPRPSWRRSPSTPPRGRHGPGPGSRSRRSAPRPPGPTAAPGSRRRTPRANPSPSASSTRPRPRPSPRPTSSPGPTPRGGRGRPPPPRPPPAIPGLRDASCSGSTPSGGYLVCLDDRVILGRAGPDSQADVPLLGDLSRDHATLVATATATSSAPTTPRSSTASPCGPPRSATAT